jgi:hypothetical protein
MKTIRVHAIILALNEEDFIYNCIDAIYPFCSGVSVVTQYDRNWRGEMLVPDNTVSNVLSYPDREGKISLVVRRHIDEAIARNAEMRSIFTQGSFSINPHDATRKQITHRYSPPDYFMIIDADELMDGETIPNVFTWVSRSNAKTINMYGYEYARTWNERVPAEYFMNYRTVFMKAGNYFHARRVASLRLMTIASLLRKIRMPQALINKMLRVATVPKEVGVFHHGALIKSPEKLAMRAKNHSEKTDYGHADTWQLGRDQNTEKIPLADLPKSIRNGNWPEAYFAL